MSFKKGDIVRIAQPLDGIVDTIKYNEDTGEPRFLVNWKNEDGEDHHRWFNAEELKPAA